MPETVAVMTALGEARFVGGAVRNALLGVGVVDIDIAVPMPPAEALARLKTRDIKVVETGIDHGTVTAIAGTHAFEVTSLRRDVETDGRHAKVVFTDDWVEDAARRDFTINALYASADRRDIRLRHGRGRPDRGQGALHGRSRARASRKIICACCACSASMPGTARAKWMPRACAPRPMRRTSSRHSRRNGWPRNCCGFWRPAIPRQCCG